MTQPTQKRNILNVADKFRGRRVTDTSAISMSQLGEIATDLLNSKNLEVSKVRPFFWSLVETYVDRFQRYPFDINRAVISYLELNDYPEDKVLDLVKNLESRFEQIHGRPLRKSVLLEPQPETQQSVLDDEIKALRDSLKYAALVDEKNT